MQPSSAQRSAYYRCSLSLLSFVESRSPSARRFGPEADALWRSFAGDLDLGDRIELLLRDADRQWGAAFGPRAVFALRATHEQDAFGASWARLTQAEAESLWTSASTTPSQPPQALALLDEIAAAWELASPAFELDKIGPSARLVVTGTAALLALAREFLTNADLSWPNQVIVVADEPGPRQLAAAVPALANHTDPTLLLTSDQASDAKGSLAQRALAKLAATPQLLASPDASESARAAAAALCPS